MASVEQLANRLALVPEAPLRVAPHNSEAEQALLGAILVNNDAFDRVSDFLNAEDFSEEIHRRIYEIASALIGVSAANSVASTARTRSSGPPPGWSNRLTP